MTSSDNPVNLDIQDDTAVTANFNPEQASIAVDKTANPTEVSEPGGLVAFTVRVDNTSATKSVTLDSLSDSIHGDLDGQGSCAVPQTIPAGGYYECGFSATVSGNAGDVETDVITASAIDDNGNAVSEDDDAMVTITDLPSSIEVTKTANPTEVPEPGGIVAFTVRVEDPSAADSVTLDSLSNSIHRELNRQGDCAVPQPIPAGGYYQCSFSVTVSGIPGYVETDVVTALASDDDGNPLSEDDDAIVTVTDLPSSIEVTKTATPTEVNEPGGLVQFSVRVDNTSTADSVTLESLTDTIYGDLDGQGSCAVPQTIPAGGYYQCSFSATVSGADGYAETNVVTATGSDDDGSLVSGEDDATVTVTNEPSGIEVTKTANPTEVPEPGGIVEFSVRVDNISTADSITLESLNNSIHGDLDGQGDCAVPQTIPVGGYYECSFNVTVSGTSGEVEIDVVTASGSDEDANPVSAEDDATVTIVGPVSCVFIQRDSFGEVADTYVWEGQPTAYYNINRLRTGYTNVSGYGEGENRTLLYFGLDWLPAGASIQSATMGVWGMHPGSGHPVGIYRITQPWVETYVTWNNNAAHFDPGSQWGGFTGAGYAQMTADVTDLVSYWVDGSAINYGMMLIDESEEPYNLETGDQYWSSEDYRDFRRPWLEVCYIEYLTNI